MRRLKLLVAGDSFMAPDPEFPGAHWSEMLPDHYQVVNVARTGLSQDQISLSVFQNVRGAIDAVVFSGTEPYRMDFRHERSHEYITNCNRDRLTSDQEKAYVLYRMMCDESLELDKCAMKLLGLLCFLTQQRIPTAWSPGVFYRDGYPGDSVLDRELSKFEHCRIPCQLAWQDPAAWMTQSPTFHISDAHIQNQYAQSVHETLLRVLDKPQG